jgi:hypothetical protein
MESRNPIVDLLNAAGIKPPWDTRIASAVLVIAIFFFVSWLL